MAGAEGPGSRLTTWAPLVDCHAHIFRADMPVAGDAWITPDYAFEAGALLGELNRHGVHFSVISGLSIAGYYNDYMISELRRHRRLRGTAIVSHGSMSTELLDTHAHLIAEDWETYPARPFNPSLQVLYRLGFKVTAEQVRALLKKQRVLPD